MMINYSVFDNQNDDQFSKCILKFNSVSLPPGRQSKLLNTRQSTMKHSHILLCRVSDAPPLSCSGN